MHNTMLVFVYDEWGGFFDRAADDRTDLFNRSGSRESRRPARIPSPRDHRRALRAPRQHCEYPFDHTSVLRFIEWRWSLEPLAERDATANNLADVLDFSTRNLTAPAYLFDPGPYAAFCPPAEPDKWETIRALAEGWGFFS